MEQTPDTNPVDHDMMMCLPGQVCEDLCVPGPSKIKKTQHADPVAPKLPPVPEPSSCDLDDKKVTEHRKSPVVEPFIPPADPAPEPSSPAPDHSGVKPNSGLWTTVSTCSSSDDTSFFAWFLPDEEQVLSRSDSLEEFLCSPLPGQVPVEPTETSTGRTAQGAVEASPVNKSSTESFESLYNVEKKIGSGGFGKVYAGTRKFDGKKVAIKRMSKIDNDCYLNIPG
ncbi:unnamed protein product [Leuciscus chuanchicus]